MANLEFLKEDESIRAVDLFYESKYESRDYLGLSQAGHECARWLWFKAHNCKVSKTPDGRVLRLFQLGHILEDQIRIDLVSAGFNIFNMQQEVKFTQDNFVLNGHIDGMISGLLESKEVHLWECKTMGNKGFQKLLKNGYEAYSEQYKWQLQFYMLGLKLKRAFVTVYNKDTSAMYQERIKLDKESTIEKLQKIFDIISQETCPRSFLCPREDFYLSKWCDYKKICWRL